MFARIAGRYDLLNHLLSAGIDRRWRRFAVAQAGPLERRLVVDACCGTGDLSLAFQRAGSRVVGVDFTGEMLRRAVGKDASRAVLFAAGDALCLPIATGAADVASVAFGIRNVEDRGRGLAELARVVRPGGRVLVLEFTKPRAKPLRWLYGWYFTRALPQIGRLVSRDREAYEYLPRTVLNWPDPASFQREMEAVGLVRCGYRLLTGGIACLHHGSVPAADGA